MDNLTKEQKDWLDKVDEIIETHTPTVTIVPLNLNKKGVDVDRLKVGKTYYAFDDGKISLGRLLQWKIIKEVDLNQHKLDIKTLEMLKYETENYGWIFSEDQRYIYYARAVDENDKYDKSIGHCWFLKSGDSYFGTGFWASRLDIDGSLYRRAMGYFEEVQKEELDNLSKTK